MVQHPPLPFPLPFPPPCPLSAPLLRLQPPLDGLCFALLGAMPILLPDVLIPLQA